MEDILYAYFPGKSWRVIASEGGANNTTRFLEIDGQKYVLRMYENHQSIDTVEYELEICQRLQARPISFQVPQPVANRAGGYCTRTEQGAVAVLFLYIPGDRAAVTNLEHVKAIGKLTAELQEAFADLCIDREPPHSPYRELYQTHPLITREVLAQFFERPPEGFNREPLNILRTEMETFEQEIGAFSDLPHQLVHGDLNCSNILVRGGRVSGVLDFEFASPDFRIMDAAIFLSELIVHVQEDRWTHVEAYLTGYGAAGGMTLREVMALPLCIKNRRMSNVIHFLGRLLAGLDDPAVAEQQLKRFVALNRWLDENAERLIRLCERKIL